MKGNGLERDTLSGVIADLEKIDASWRNDSPRLNYATLRDALFYLKAFRDTNARLNENNELLRENNKRLIAVLREVRGEK